MSQLEEQLKRIGILESAGVVSKQAADFTRYAASVFCDRDYDSDSLETFITHLAMASQRVINKDAEAGYDEAVLESLKEEEGYQAALEMRDSLLDHCDIEFSDSERQFLLVHILNLLS